MCNRRVGSLCVQCAVRVQCAVEGLDVCSYGLACGAHTRSRRCFGERNVSVMFQRTFLNYPDRDHCPFRKVKNDTNSSFVENATKKHKAKKRSFKGVLEGPQATKDISICIYKQCKCKKKMRWGPPHSGFSKEDFDKKGKEPQGPNNVPPNVLELTGKGGSVKVPVAETQRNADGEDRTPRTARTGGGALLVTDAGSGEDHASSAQDWATDDAAKEENSSSFLEDQIQNLRPGDGLHLRHPDGPEVALISLNEWLLSNITDGEEIHVPELDTEGLSCSAYGANECGQCDEHMAESLMPQKDYDWQDAEMRWHKADVTMTCQPRACVCHGGWGEFGKKCPGLYQPKCARCDEPKYYMKKSESTCIANCTCTGGTQAIGEKQCTKPEEHCVGCDSGYVLTKTTQQSNFHNTTKAPFCQPVCKCPLGKPATGKNLQRVV